MAVNIQSVIKFWKDFDLTQFQRDLDQTATNIATKQDESDASRKKLVEQMKLFKRSSSDEVRRSVASLLKSFQTEIDSLTKRCKFGETGFLTVYKKVIELPEPTLALEQAEHFQRKNQRFNDIETENQKLRDTLQEYNKEFAEVKNQEVTIKSLRDKVKELERESSSKAQKKIEEEVELMKKDFENQEKKLHESQVFANNKLGDAEQKAMTLRSALDASQSELFNLKAKYDEEFAAKHAELEMIVSDLERAQQTNEMLSKEIETLKENGTQEKPEILTLNQSMEQLSKVTLESELALKDREIFQLVEDIQHLQSSLMKLRESSANSLVNLEQELCVKEDTISKLQAKLSQHSDYDELKHELTILKSTEFGNLNNEAKSIEMLLMDKNRVLQNENTSLRAANSQLTDFTKILENKLQNSEKTASDQLKLIEKLEVDLLLIQSPASVVRSAADGSPAPQKSHEIVANAINNSDGADTSENSLLLIVSSQRERFRVRNNELEAENYTQQQNVVRLQAEVDNMRGDNVKLYEKIKYLQSYPTSTKVPVEDLTSNRYSSQYEDAIDPFASFNKKEKQRKYLNLSPPEKVTLGISRIILSSKVARMIFFFYMLFMHCLLYLVLYKYAYADDCRHHLSELCLEKFGHLPNKKL